METATNVVRRPFHETIVDAINHFDRSPDEIFVLESLIKSTKIPKGHDKIIEAVWEKWTPISLSLATEMREVLLAQKSEADEEAKSKEMLRQSVVVGG